MEIMKKTKKCKTKRSISTLVLLFIIFELVFTATTGTFVEYYDPFGNARNEVVGEAMTTLRSQWIATLFLSDKEIKQIMNEQKVETIVKKSLDGLNSSVKIEHKDDNSIER